MCLSILPSHHEEIWLCLSLSLDVFLYMFLSLSISLLPCLSLSLIYLSLYLSIYVSDYVSFSLPLSLSLSLSPPQVSRQKVHKKMWLVGVWSGACIGFAFDNTCRGCLISTFLGVAPMAAADKTA